MSAHLFGLTDRTFSYTHSLGRNEFAGTGFRNPVDIAVTGDGTTYVVNRSREDRPDGLRISVVTLEEEYISEFASHGQGDGQFIWPSSIALDDKNDLYVSDEWLNRITIFNKDGDFLGKWGQSGTGDGQLNKPAGVAIHGDTLLLTDSQNNRIQKFGLDGTYRGQFGSFGSGQGQFNLPWGISIDAQGLVYVADWRNDRIQQFNMDGEWQATFGQSGTNIGQFKRPASVCTDEDGDIYVADWGNNRVQVLSPDGRFVAQFHGDHVLSQWGREKLISNPDMLRQRSIAFANDGGSFERVFAQPCAVKIDNKGRLAVVENWSGRIQVYAKTREPALV
jgi:DNA-binding beta-propeller fold protein YncE